MGSAWPDGSRMSRGELEHFAPAGRGTRRSLVLPWSHEHQQPRGMRPVVTFIGLSLTWVRYTGTPPRVLAKRVLGWLPQRKRTPQNVAIHAGVAEAVTAVDAVGVVVTDGSVEARLAQVEVELEAFRAQSQRGQAALRDHVDNEDSKLRTSVGGLATDLETLTAQVESYRKETALSGLGWAAIGVVVTTIGTLLASVPGVCTP
jgi:hypothetical protein